jgi:uncharacterized membrane protein YeiH
MTFLEKMAHWAQFLVSGAVVFAFFALIAGMLIYVKQDFPPGVREVLMVLTGVLAGAFKDVVGFWIGSSASSQKKDAAMAGKQ